MLVGSQKGWEEVETVPKLVRIFRVGRITKKEESVDDVVISY